VTGAPAPSRGRDVLARLSLAVLPLLLTLLFGWLWGEGYLRFSGGDKDIFLIVPPSIWSLAYLVSCGVHWWRGSTIRRMALASVGMATAFVAVAWMILFVVAWVKFG